MRMILVTGFQGYGGRSANPSEKVARALDGVRIGGLIVRGHVLPVDFAAMRRQLPALIDDLRPRLILSLGLWPGEPVLRLERMASNWSWFELPDNAGHRQNGRVCADGPDGYLTTLPADAMQAAIRAAGLPCRQSGSAGSYLCNATLYTVLHYCAQSHPAAQAGFMHLPYLPAQVAALLDQIADDGRLEMHQRADLASMHLDDMMTGLRLGLETAAAMALA
jgi:pyroglutamyl-peptidase